MGKSKNGKPKRIRRTFTEDFKGDAVWLPRYMLEHGTWNTPIIILQNNGDLGLRENFFRKPLHLLEGHRRLSYMHRLMETGRAAEKHEVFFASLDTTRPAPEFDWED